MTGHGIDAASAAGIPPADVPDTGLPGLAQKLLTPVNTLMAIFSAIALLAASCVLTWEVVGRYFLAIPSDWQDELSAILLIAATFTSAGWIQARRGHVAIDALSHVLPPAVDRVRRRVADLCAFAFCAYFAFKSFQLFREAWEEGQTTPSAWGSPLWIPYGCMAFGMALLALQQCTQLLGARRRP